MQKPLLTILNVFFYFFADCFGNPDVDGIFALPVKEGEGCEVMGQGKKGSIAQLVQSICLTSRGSLVRIHVLPQKIHRLGGFFFVGYFEKW